MQTTFGGAATNNGVAQLSSPEQSFTIPSYKKPPSSSTHTTAKKDILSTPVLIAPTITSTSASTLVSSLSASSTQAVALNPSNLPNGNVAAAFVRFRSAARDIKIANANSHKIVASRTSTANDSSTKNTFSSDSSSSKNYSNLFETVNVIRSTPSSSSITNQHRKLETSLSAAASHQRKSGDSPEYYVSDKENRNDTTVTNESNVFACQKQLDDCPNLSRLKNGNSSANDPAPKQSAIVTEVLLPHETTTKTTMLVDMYVVAATPSDNDASGKILNSYSTPNGTLKVDRTYNGIPSTSSCTNLNNNLDFNVQECMDQMLAADSPFDKLNYLQQMNNNPSSSYDAYKISANSHKSMENIYENCARLSAKQNDDDNRDADTATNYYQQDSNENIISSKSNGVSAINDSTNNTAHTNSTGNNCAQKSNNNSISNSSNYNNQIFFVANTTELHDIQEIDDDDGNIGDTDDTQNDDEHAFVSRYGSNWSTAKNPALAKHHKNYAPSMAMSSASFAAAAAAMNDFKTTNRNPFLQLMESPAPTTSAGPSIFSNGLSPRDENIALPTSTNNNINDPAYGFNEPIKLFDSLASLVIVAASMTRENGENDAIDACLVKLLATEMKMANGQVMPSVSNGTDTVSADAVRALQLCLKERDGNNYVKQFLQVIFQIAEQTKYILHFTVLWLNEAIARARAPAPIHVKWCTSAPFAWW